MRFSLSWESRQRLPRRPSAPRSLEITGEGYSVNCSNYCLTARLGIIRTDREALGPLLEGFSRCCPQPGYRSGYDQG